MTFTTTPRLTLRNLQDKDFQSFLDYRSDPEICRYQTLEIFSEAAAKNFIQEQQEANIETPGEWTQIGIALKDSDLLIGDCAVKRLEEEPRIVEIGYTISGKYQKKGYATEALKGLFRFLFEEKNIHKINAIVDFRNEASIQVVKKLGFTQEAFLRKSYWEEGAWWDEYIFALLEEDEIPD